MAVQRREYRLRGVVQGVGFRPHVATVAARFPLTGSCANTDAGVVICAQGEVAVLERFFAELLADLPPLATVVDTQSRHLPVIAEEVGFQILASQESSGERSLIPPDVALCPDCAAELADPSNRRYRYPFMTCTQCGPRLSIITQLPYDRPLTTMAQFPLCPQCAREYADPQDRRYHAQPISCRDCGPTLWLTDAAGKDLVPAAAAGSPAVQAQTDAVIAAAQQLLDAGQIIAVKGLGGFHLLCDATQEEAVARLRERKQRPDKPLAVMVRNLSEAHSLVALTPETEALLTSPAHPIVVAPAQPQSPLAPSIAPRLAEVGIMLPYTPLHALLVDRPVVATSGNRAGQPLCAENDAALATLGEIADAFLCHNRGIHLPVEDSVFRATHPVRRSRGYAPLPVPLSGSGPTVLAIGGELKNTFTLTVGDYAHVSSHNGDQGSLQGFAVLERGVDQMLSRLREQPTLIACDLHPGYATTRWAEDYATARGLPLVQVQHHYAHALSLLTEHGITDGPAVIATLDGTGYGTDSTIWGGEILTLGEQLSDWERSWHLPCFPLVGGDRAVRFPWRLAVGMASAYGLDLTALDAHLPAAELALVRSQLAHSVGVVQTSSLGRLFDAAAVLTTHPVAAAVSYEGQAAIEFEQCALTAQQHHSSRADTWTALLAELLETTVALPERCWRFHDGVARLLATELAAAAQRAGTRIVGVTGGCALNLLLVARLRAYLSDADLELLTHAVVPANDGGLSLGQAVAGRLLHPGVTDS